MTAEDVAYLRTFYDAYRRQLAPLLEESKAYAQLVSTLDKQLTATRAAD